jgi:hypothetical protein
MLSFVVQNFNSYTPFLIKTQRYNKIIISQTTGLLYMFIKQNLFVNTDIVKYLNYNSYMLFFHTKFFQKPLWKIVKSINTKKFGIQTSNLTRSAIFHTCNDLDNFISLKQTPLSYTPTTLNATHRLYKKAIPILNFSFNKQTFNKLIIYILNLITIQFYSTNSNFNLLYSIILFPQNFFIFTFVNVFYFRLRHF